MVAGRYRLLQVVSNECILVNAIIAGMRAGVESFIGIIDAPGHNRGSLGSWHSSWYHLDTDCHQWREP